MNNGSRVIRFTVFALLVCILAVNLLGCSQLEDLIGQYAGRQPKQALAEFDPVTMKVDCDSLCIYATAEAVEPVGTLVYGDTVSVDATKTVDGIRWGRTPNGWVQLDGLVMSGEDSAAQYPPYGIVKADVLNIRSGPGTGYDVVGSLPNGSSVEFLEFTDNWGRMDRGWVSLDYIVFQDEPAPPAGTQSGSAQINSPIVGQWIWAQYMPETDRVYRSSTVTYNADGTYELVHHDCIFMYQEGEGWIRDPNATAAGSQVNRGTYTFDGSTLVHSCTFIEWDDTTPLPVVSSYQVQINGNLMDIDGQQWYYGDLQEVCNYLTNH